MYTATASQQCLHELMSKTVAEEQVEGYLLKTQFRPSQPVLQNRAKQWKHIAPGLSKTYDCFIVVQSHGTGHLGHKIPTSCCACHSCLSTGRFWLHNHRKQCRPRHSGSACSMSDRDLELRLGCHDHNTSQTQCDDISVQAWAGSTSTATLLQY